eukprot:Hpha_TRINITY_DN16008_c3_g8::TRINITY_DN16008_c3_g8_i1::g.120527::m.120527
MKRQERPPPPLLPTIRSMLTPPSSVLGQLLPQPTVPPLETLLPEPSAPDEPSPQQYTDILSLHSKQLKSFDGTICITVQPEATGSAARAVPMSLGEHPTLLAFS